MALERLRYTTPQRASVISENLLKTNFSESLMLQKREPLQITVREADATAQYLADKFHHPGGLAFYQKVAWHIPRGTIDRLVTLAFEKGRNPAKLFSFLAKNEGGF